MSYYARSYTPADGTTRDFTVDFPYLDRGHIHVLLNGVETAAFVWINASLIRLNTAPAAGTLVARVRQTSPQSRLVDYVSPSSLNEDDLDTDSLQGFYLAQEAQDAVKATVSDDVVTGHFTANGKRINNVANPVDQQDVATRNWTETAMSSQVAQATAQAAIATSAANTSSSKAGQSAASQAASAQSEVNAAGSAMQAAGHVTAAASQAEEAADSAAEAAARKTEVDVLKDAVEGLESAAATSAITATNAANATQVLYDNFMSAYENFNDRYLGSHATPPTTDNEGDPLVGGALYFDTSSSPGAMKVWDGSEWRAAYVSFEGTPLLAAGNLGDLTNVPQARINLGLGSVNNTPDSAKPVSTAQQSALDLKLDKASIWKGTLAAYNAITTKDPDVLYFVRP